MCVQAIMLRQFFMGAAFGDLSVFDHQDLIGAADRTEPVRNGDDRSFSGNVIDRIPD